jgi:hypothetical protein
MDARQVVTLAKVEDIPNTDQLPEIQTYSQ